MVATRSSKRPTRPPSARRHAFVTKTTGGLTAYKTAHLFGAQATYGDKHAHRSLFKNRWKYDAEHSNEEVSVFHNRNDTMVAFRGSKTLNDWVNTDRHILTGTPVDKDDRFKRNAKHAVDVYSAYPNRKHTYTGHSLGGTIAHFVHRSMNGHAAFAFNPGTSIFENKGVREAMQRAAKAAARLKTTIPATIAKKSITHRIEKDPFSTQTPHSFPGSVHVEHQVALNMGMM